MATTDTPTSSPEKQSKISTRLIVYIILFSSMITAIVTIIQLFHQYKEDRSLLDANIQNINTGYREGITNAVWLDDKVQLNSILDGVVALPDIEYIEVRVKDEIYASLGNRVKTNAESSSFLLQRMHDNKLLTIGETYVEADLSTIYKRLVNHAWTILALNAIKTFIVAIFMYFIFDRLVVRRLETLSKYVGRYDIQNLKHIEEIHSVTGEKYSDEISEIANALYASYKELSRSVKDLIDLKKTLDLSMDAVIMFHPDNYKIFYANAGASMLLGYSTEELVNMTPADICTNLSESVLTEVARTAINTDQHMVDMDTYFKSKDGNPIPVRLILQYLQPENESPRYVFMARDISDRISAQIEIQSSLEEARAANTELESFSYSISHDLRAPLRSIDGFSLLLMQDYANKLDDEGKDYINRVRKSAQQMGLLIDDMLSLSHVNRGELNREEHDLSKMAWSSIRKLQEYEPNRNVNLTITPGIIGWVDESLFQNLLDNLLGNAWKYTGKTSNPSIEFGTTEQGGEEIYFVRDNGAGFDMAYSNKLFSAFQRLHEANEFTGTGIGLATVSRILIRHGGRIWAEGEIGKGATFYFTIEKQQNMASANEVKQQLRS